MFDHFSFFYIKNSVSNGTYHTRGGGANGVQVVEMENFVCKAFLFGL